MATTAIDSADLSLLRGSHQHIDDLTIWITPLTVIQSGITTAVPTLSPFIQVTWSGSTSGIVVGQMVKITNGATLKGYAVVRKLPTGNTLFISATPLGHPGFSTRIENVIEVGVTVTV